MLKMLTTCYSYLLILLSITTPLFLLYNFECLFKSEYYPVIKYFFPLSQYDLFVPKECSLLSKLSIIKNLALTPHLIFYFSLFIICGSLMYRIITTKGISNKYFIVKQNIRDFEIAHIIFSCSILTNLYSLYCLSKNNALFVNLLFFMFINFVFYVCIKRLSSNIKHNNKSKNIRNFVQLICSFKIYFTTLIVPLLIDYLSIIYSLLSPYKIHFVSIYNGLHMFYLDYVVIYLLLIAIYKILNRC